MTQKFIDSGGKWEEISISNIFELESSKKIFHANQLKIYEEEIDGSHPYVVRTVFNNGVRGYIIAEDVHLNSKNAITFAQDTFYASYQKIDFFTGNKVKILRLKQDTLNRETGLFFAALINKSIESSTWGEGSTMESIISTKMYVPIRKGEIANEFIKKYIEILENENKKIIEQYINDSGITDFEITKEDEKILEKLNSVDWKKFELSDFLEWGKAIKEINPLKIMEYSRASDVKYPFYGQATINNGIIDYISLKSKYLNNKDSLPTILIHSNNQNIIFVDTPFYLKNGHGATSVLQSPFMDKNNVFFIIATIKNIIEKKFSYNNKATKIGLRETKVYLPIDKEGNIEFSIMTNVIKVIRKKILNELINKKGF